MDFFGRLGDAEEAEPPSEEAEPLSEEAEPPSEEAEPPSDEPVSMIIYLHTHTHTHTHTNRLRKNQHLKTSYRHTAKTRIYSAIGSI